MVDTRALVPRRVWDRERPGQIVLEEEGPAAHIGTIGYTDDTL